MAIRRKCFLPFLPSRTLCGERGNVMVYVLVVVALFAALGFVLARQSDTSEADTISEAQTEIYASTIMQASMQLKQSVEQMRFTGIAVADLDFITPDDVNFDVGPPTEKVFHPHGGGVALPRLPDEAVDQISADPPARWYIGRFNDMEWAPRSKDDVDNAVVRNDVILTAHQIKESVCARINEKLTGSPVIPQIAGDQINEILIDEYESTAAGNIAFTSAHCASCYGRPSLCVQENGASAWSFYSLIVEGRVDY